MRLPPSRLRRQPKREEGAVIWAAAHQPLADLAAEVACGLADVRGEAHVAGPRRRVVVAGGARGPNPGREFVLAGALAAACLDPGLHCERRLA